MNLDTKLTVPPQVMSRLVGDETVVLNLESGLYFGLDGVGQLIWEAASDGQPLSAAVEKIVATYEVDEMQATSDVAEFAAQLVEKGLLVE